MNKITMGSFFSGSGGFELAAKKVGISTLWASEIEPFPIRVTKARFPELKHIGDIKKIDGTCLTPTDVVAGGSPCQNLSVAGKRAGLNGEQSILFREYIRVVKEMRKKHGKPRFFIWENVPGVFSSNKGEDFRCILEEIVQIKDTDILIPLPPKGKWKTAGYIVGDSYSIAWRVLDAQYWGVPQRRRRIYLVADFDGTYAGEILFKREGLQRDIKKSQNAQKETSRNAQNSIGAGEQMFPVAYGICAIESNAMRSDNPNSGFYKANTSRTIDCRGGNPCCHQGGIAIVEKKPIYTIQGNLINRKEKNGPMGSGIQENISFTLTAGDKHAVAYDQNDNYIIRKLTPLECCRLQGFPDDWIDGLVEEEPLEEEVSFWMQIWKEWWTSYGQMKGVKHPKNEKAVKRWLKTKPSDNALYKMWGNGIALPCALYVFEGLAEVLKKER